jgi:hypothetical protein
MEKTTFSAASVALYDRISQFVGDLSKSQIDFKSSNSIKSLKATASGLQKDIEGFANSTEKDSWVRSLCLLFDIYLSLFCFVARYRFRDVEYLRSHVSENHFPHAFLFSALLFQ